MNFRKTLPVALCALIAAALPAFSAGTADDRAPGPKDLFRTQLKNQSEESNTGVQYWIELKRGSEHTRVSNKYPFKTGDQVRFHLVPNIDGYAYVLLKSGSRGERAVLFPNERLNENNKVAHGIDVMIPGDGTYLQFDENPGTEQLSLVVSRQPINATAYLEQQNAPVMIASSEGGSKDLIPTKCYVSYGIPHSRPIREKEELLTAAAPEKKVEKQPEAYKGMEKTQLVRVKRTPTKPAPEKQKPAVARSTRTAPATHLIAQAPHAGAHRTSTIKGKVQVDADADPSVTTVVFQGTGALQVDVALDHN